VSRPRAELVADLARTRDEVSAFFRSLPPGVFTRGTPEQWSPSHHLDHLTRSNSPVVKALTVARDRLPRMREDHPPRSASALRDLYREALRGGVKASGRYLPDPSGDQTAQLAEYAGTLDALRAALADWSEADLDGSALLHPALGELSVREMLEFTLAHNEHHLRGVQARLNRMEQP
jgi:hypothetical protein